MLVDLAQHPLVIGPVAFLLGWVVATVRVRLRATKEAPERDPRDLRIRSLEAEYRVAQADVDQFKDEVAGLETEVEDLASGLEQRDKVITEQQAKIDQLRLDLTSSVRKTRQLREELAERATENVHAEAKLREVETELSVAQASTDLIYSGVLKYDFDDLEDEDKTAVLEERF